MSASRAESLELDIPDVMLNNVAAELAVSGAQPGSSVQLSVGDREYQALAGVDGRATFAEVVVPDTGAVAVRASGSGGAVAAASLRVIPAWISIAPPLIAIAIALTLRNVIPALLIGIWFGATAIRGFSPAGMFHGLLDSFAVFVTTALLDPNRVAIILFSLMIGGMVGIITRNGGMASVVQLIVSRARTAAGGQVSVWLMGLMIFFDDYSNTLVVGNTARPMTDHLQISREKLAYIVDSTAAPVVCLALITTWIGYEVGLIDAAISSLPGISQPAYTIFLHSIPYLFYPILAIIFVFAVAYSGRDMGPMYKAEVRARNGTVSPVKADEMPALEGDSLDAKADIPLRAVNAFVPLLVLIAGLIGGLYATGEGDTLTDIVGSADSYKAMMWASFLGAITAAVMTVGQGILSAHETVDAWYGGVRAMMFAMIVLVLAWSLSDVTQELHTAGFLVSVLAETLAVALVPATVFILSAITAFTTGTSWGTMGILMPLVIPLAWAVLGVNGMQSPEHMHILYSAIACNLAGAVWGDHCSPISDTTVLSSMASGCDHIEHVRTQMPYALLVGIVAICLGTIPGGFGFPPLLSIIIGAVLLVSILRYYGRCSDHTTDSAKTDTQKS
jgi:Na+/H+ antiporter NhaC